VAASAFSKTPIVISEADPDGCAACPLTNARQNAYRLSPAYGAYEVAMMKRSLDLAEELGVNLNGVLTWAFTFPGTEFFAGYRALSTNGIHLPVMNAFKLLGSLDGARLPVSSSGSRPMSDLLENSVRQAPDVDALATLSGDKVQILVWNYHDDLVDAPVAPVTLQVAVPSRFGRAVVLRHSRVDTVHGNAYTAWESQGRPAAPSTAQLAALRDAMDAVSFEPARRIDVADGRVTVSFDLPRFGISQLTLEPAEPGAVAPASSTTEGCGCTLAGPRRAAPQALLVFAFAALVTRRRGRAASSARIGSK
jgi:xylan 1,4-beta-xylosidase